MARSKSSNPRRPLSARLHEVDRTLIACFALLWIFAFAFIMGDGWPTKPLRQLLFKQTPVAGNTSQGDDGLATGSIVFIPARGETCRQSLIDNTTWRISPVGNVPCETVLGGEESLRQAGVNRLNVVRDSFRNK